jgi:hypothetical protein
MTLTKNKMVREIGRRTRLTNRDVQAMLGALVEIWTEELVSGGRVEIENFIVLETQTIDRSNASGLLGYGDRKHQAPRYIHKVSLRTSKALRSKLGKSDQFK